MIGHNAPPVHEAFSLHIEELFATVSATLAGTTVENDDQEAALAQLMDEVRQAGKDADAHRAAEKRPHDDAAKAVQAKWKPLVDRCDAGVKALKDKLTPYRVKKQQAAEAAAAAARAEAEARTHAAQEALRSDDLEERFAAEQDLKTAKHLTVAANKAVSAPTGLRTHWTADLADPVAALKHYRAAQPDALKAWLLEQAQRDVNSGARVIPGFNITERKKAA